jgi:hypothetical protein
MWRLAVLALLLCAGCENSPFYRARTEDWFPPLSSSAPAVPPGLSTSAAPQASAAGNGSAVRP